MGLTPADRRAGLGDRGLITTYVAIANGELAEPTSTVRELAGHDPQRLEAFLEQHPESYAHLL